MQLRGLIKKIRQEKKWTQVQMGAALQINQQDVQGMENAGRNLEKQFSIFLKMLAVCRELGIDPAQELESEALIGGLINDSVVKTSKIDQRKKKAGGKK